MNPNPNTLARDAAHEEAAKLIAVAEDYRAKGMNKTARRYFYLASAYERRALDVTVAGNSRMLGILAVSYVSLLRKSGDVDAARTEARRLLDLLRGLLPENARKGLEEEAE